MKEWVVVPAEHAVMLALRFVGKEAAEYPAIDDGFAELLTVVENGVPSCIESVISEFKARNVGYTLKATSGLNSLFTIASMYTRRRS